MQLQGRKCEIKPAASIFTSVLGSDLHPGLVEMRAREEV